MRTSLLPTVIVLLLVGLVVLLPDRETPVPGSGTPILPGSAGAGQDVAMILAQVPAPNLTEPPAWCLARGVDAVARRLDRVGWAGHGPLVTAAAELAREGGQISGQVLARLEDLGDGDPILVSKLIPILGNDPSPSPHVVEELVRRALSDNALVARAALKVLAYCPDPAALGGVLGRLHDDTGEVRSYARAALAERARAGDTEARAYLLDELERTAAVPDLAYITVLGETPADERGLAVLRRIINEADLSESMAALASLLVHRDPMAIERVEQMLVDGDLAGRINALRMAALAGVVLGRDHWLEIVAGRQRTTVLALMSILVQAIETGDDDALLAVQLLEEMSGDPTHPCQADALDALLQQGHPFAVERTRYELQRATGPYLSVTVDRIVRADPDLAREFVPLAASRVDDPETPWPDRIVLCRLLARADAEGSAARVVRLALEGDGTQAEDLLPYLAQMGAFALADLAPSVDTDRGAALMVFVAAVSGAPESLPMLEALVLDTGRDRGLRMKAMDSIVRLKAGPREHALRELAKTLGDPVFSERARLLFWNYL